LAVLFPRWTNVLSAVITSLVLVGGPLVVCLVWYYASPWNTDVGYAPVQPVPYSHKQHAGLLGMDCRYCHQAVEVGPKATIPANQTCMNCHTLVKPKSEFLAPLVASYEGGPPLRWVKVHMLPEYAYFDHSAHCNAGIGCASCHGRIDQMDIVRQDQPLSMSWCLECHAAPEIHLRPVGEITNMEYPQSLEEGLRLKQTKNINPPIHCSACHR
jgi:hypothetical protein